MENYLGKDIPKLGFGLMRLPMLDGEIDIEQTKKMTDLFLEHGYTYFDTSYVYSNGKSEEAAKKALVDRHPRESFQLADKLSAWAVSTAEEARQMLWTSLKRTGSDYFDFYLLHNLGDKRTKYFDEFGIWDFLSEQKEKGFIRHLGLSIHDKASVLDELLTNHPEMEFVQLQINYADWENPMTESKKCYETALKHKKPVIIMEPVRGGSLSAPPPEVVSLMKKANPEASITSWAIRFAASLDNIITVLSGMSDLDQMRDNLASIDNFKILDSREQIIIAEAQKILASFPEIPCTACNYCLRECPEDIHIPLIFRAMNRNTVYGTLNKARSNYLWALENGAKGSSCAACGRCEAICPQHIHIIDELKKAVALLE